MAHAIRWALFPRYRALCRSRAERHRRNRDRARRQFEKLRREILDAYVTATDYGEARRLMFLIARFDL